MNPLNMYDLLEWHKKIMIEQYLCVNSRFSSNLEELTRLSYGMALIESYKVMPGLWQEGVLMIRAIDICDLAQVAILDLSYYENRQAHQVILGQTVKNLETLPQDFKKLDRREYRYFVESTQNLSDSFKFFVSKLFYA